MPSPFEIGQTPRSPSQLMPSLAISSQGMAIQMRFLEVIASNIANSETTKGPGGDAYRRQVAILEVDPETGLLQARTIEDASPGHVAYDPGHPHADEDGYVEYPNVDLNSEMVDLMIARRIHQANASVFQAAKAMLKSAMEI